MSLPASADPRSGEPASAGDPPFDGRTPEEAIAALVDAVKQAPERRDLLVQLLPERLSLYDGRSTNETMRIRGYIFAAFEQTGLPDAALPYILEELESGRDAYLVAGAAKAVRGLPHPSRQVVPFLLKAVENIKYVDDAVTFECYKPRWPVTSHTTALSEIFRTLGWLGAEGAAALPDLEAFCAERRDEFSQPRRREIAQAIAQIRADSSAAPDCCAGHSAPLTLHSAPPRKRQRPSGLLRDIELEDQDGNSLTYGAFFRDKPAVVVFFYTRCTNPNKCSLTITQLGRLQQAIGAAGLAGRLKTAAITYDPEYDLPPRLKAYGENRGVVFSGDQRILRTKTGFDLLREAFQLGVNYGGATVNRHRIELFILDRQGEIAATVARLQWDVQDVLEQAQALLSGEPPG